MGDDLDALTDQLSEGFNVDPTALGKHPRYSKYKNLSRAAEQQAKRREEALERHHEGRFEKLLQLRKIALDESDEEDLEKDNTESIASTDDEYTHLPKKSRFADRLLLSEWLVDIPAELSTDWTMVAAPVGRRCLVVASRGYTSAYTKSGRKFMHFQSSLPGGSKQGKYTYTIVDCILSHNIFYILDMMSWNKRDYADNPFDFRSFMLKSKVEEHPELITISNKNKYKFVPAPRVLCTTANIEKTLAQPFDFQLDGLLFYHNEVFYEAGQSPLVGWLKPWMIPDILKVNVHSSYMEGGEKYETPQQFINKFNEKHGHKSQVQKSMET